MAGRGICFPGRSSDRNAGEHLPHDGGPVNSQRLGAHIAGGDAAFGDEERGTQREVRDNGGDGVRDLSGDTQLLFRTGAARQIEPVPAGVDRHSMPLADQLIRQGGYPCCLVGQPTRLKDEMLVELNKFKGTAALPQSLHLPGGLVDVGAHNDYAAIVVLRVDEVGAGEERPIRNSAQDLGDRRSGAQQEPLSLPYDLEQSGGKDHGVGIIPRSPR